MISAINPVLSPWPRIPDLMNYHKHISHIILGNNLQHNPQGLNFATEDMLLLIR